VHDRRERAFAIHPKFERLKALDQGEGMQIILKYLSVYLQGGLFNPGKDV
jgi:hypothetical protein